MLLRTTPLPSPSFSLNFRYALSNGIIAHISSYDNKIFYTVEEPPFSKKEKEIIYTITNALLKVISFSSADYMSYMEQQTIEETVEKTAEQLKSTESIIETDFKKFFDIALSQAGITLKKDLYKKCFNYLITELVYFGIIEHIIKDELITEISIIENLPQDTSIYTPTYKSTESNSASHTTPCQVFLTHKMYGKITLQNAIQENTLNKIKQYLLLTPNLRKDITIESSIHQSNPYQKSQNNKSQNNKNKINEIKIKKHYKSPKEILSLFHPTIISYLWKKIEDHSSIILYFVYKIHPRDELKNSCIQSSYLEFISSFTQKTKKTITINSYSPNAITYIYKKETEKLSKTNKSETSNKIHELNKLILEIKKEKPEIIISQDIETNTLYPLKALFNAQLITLCPFHLVKDIYEDIQKIKNIHTHTTNSIDNYNADNKNNINNENNTNNKSKKPQYENWQLNEKEKNNETIIIILNDNIIKIISIKKNTINKIAEYNLSTKQLKFNIKLFTIQQIDSILKKRKFLLNLKENTTDNLANFQRAIMLYYLQLQNKKIAVKS